MKLFLHFYTPESKIQNYVIELPMLPRVGDFIAAQELDGRVFRVTAVLHSKPADTVAEIMAVETSFSAFLKQSEIPPARNASGNNLQTEDAQNETDDLDG